MLKGPETVARMTAEVIGTDVTVPSNTDALKSSNLETASNFTIDPVIALTLLERRFPKLECSSAITVWHQIRIKSSEMPKTKPDMKLDWCSGLGLVLSTYQGIMVTDEF